MNNPEDDGARRREVAQKAGELVSEKMSDLWWTFLVRGIVALLLGILALFWPSDSISWLLRLFGLFLVFFTPIGGEQGQGDGQVIMRAVLGQVRR